MFASNTELCISTVAIPSQQGSDTFVDVELPDADASQISGCSKPSKSDLQYTEIADVKKDIDGNPFSCKKNTNLFSRLNGVVQNYRGRPRRVYTPEEQQARCMFCTFLAVIIIIVASVLIALSLNKVGETEYGVKYTNYKKELDDSAVNGGLFAGPPGM